MHLFQYAQISNLTFTFALSIKQTLSFNKAFSFNNSKQNLFEISNQSQPSPFSFVHAEGRRALRTGYHLLEFSPCQNHSNSYLQVIAEYYVRDDVHYLSALRIGSDFANGREAVWFRREGFVPPPTLPNIKGGEYILIQQLELESKALMPK
ncbi:hypothetical protein CDAR_498251 [Caerostris darwini]|uniref:Uncharacterized protein n=1 Tax=Caerostris darwini TaxID=1538125 RepID=A0AAV4U007_9ARAC|nr:hypothetical protein CDAR_498251 [Caerostris darwini]